MSDGSIGLTAVSDPDLEHLLQDISTGSLTCPLTTAALSRAGLGHLKSVMPTLQGLDAIATRTVLSTVVAERRLRTPARIDLVWTGPEVPSSISRDTMVVVEELFASAKERVLIAGFWFHDAAIIFRPLHARMRDRSVESTLFLHLPEITPHTDVESHVAEHVGRFMRNSWPFGDPRPALFYSPETVRAGALASMHAKCIVVDERRALVTSANFTSRAQTRNIEVGALIDDATFARSLVQQWRSAANAGFFVPV